MRRCLLRELLKTSVSPAEEVPYAGHFRARGPTDGVVLNDSVSFSTFFAFFRMIVEFKRGPRCLRVNRRVHRVRFRYFCKIATLLGDLQKSRSEVPADKQVLSVFASRSQCIPTLRKLAC